MIPSKPHNTYCIPFALAYLMDTSIEGACKAIEKHLGDQDIRGIWFPLAIRILRDARYCVKERVLVNEWRTTVGKLTKLLKRDTKYLILVKGHGLVYHNGIFDNGHPDGVDTKLYRYQNAPVQSLFVITKEGDRS